MMVQFHGISGLSRSAPETAPTLAAAAAAAAADIAAAPAAGEAPAEAEAVGVLVPVPVPVRPASKEGCSGKKPGSDGRRNEGGAAADGKRPNCGADEVECMPDPEDVPFMVADADATPPNVRC
jgi:hypothetical protein